MNDFFLANNDCKTNKSGQSINQVIVKDLEQWAAIAEPIRMNLKKNYSDESLESAIQSHKLQSLMLCLFVVDVTEQNLHELINKDADKFIELFKDVILVNKAYFDQEDKKESTKKDKSTWFDTFQFLVSKGHRHKDILNYSFGAFLEYLKAAQRNESNHMVSFGGAMRVAYHADKKGFSKYIDSMSKF